MLAAKTRYWRRTHLLTSRSLITVVIVCACLYIFYVSLVTQETTWSSPSAGNSKEGGLNDGNEHARVVGSSIDSSNSNIRPRLSDVTVQLEQAYSPTTFGDPQGEGLTKRYGLKLKTVQRQLELAERDYQYQVKLRNQTLDRLSFKAGYFPAAFRCPHQIERYGPIDDGGRWMCGMEIYAESPRRPKCVVYSFGLRDETQWEEEVLARTNCEIWGFDASLSDLGEALKSHPRMHFEKISLGRESKVDSKGVVWQTLQMIMKRLGHTWIDILKVDIEGFEFDTFHGLMDYYDVFPFAQLQIELHVRNIAFHSFLEFWRRWEDKGLRPFWAEVNPHPAVYLREVPWASEYSFINTKGGQQNLLIQNY
ncbi:hypothetical protein BGZ73_000925 [Actinomortierella ambigua]|nr:hypothetical protein BGZ73_000925 [Actinomortierella ambigua]